MFNWIFSHFHGLGQGGSGHGQASSVPEMDASNGVLAIAAVLAALVLAWEIKRRRRARS